MKLNQFVWLGLTSLIVTTLPLSSLATPQSISSSTNRAESTLIAQKQADALSSGKFTATEKPTRGTARIVQEDGHHYLELDGDFRTSSQVSNLYIILDRDSKPSETYDDQDETINLGRLQHYSGAQRYVIPDDVNIDDYRSVSIWNQAENIISGYARLRSTEKRDSWMPTFSELYWERSDG